MTTKRMTVRDMADASAAYDGLSAELELDGYLFVLKEDALIPDD